MTPRTRRLRDGVIIALLVTMMVGVPLLGLLSPRPARLGWQMYTVAHDAPRAWSLTDVGVAEPIEIVERFAVLRGDLPDATAVALAACRLVDATRIRVELRPGVAGEADCS